MSGRLKSTAENARGARVPPRWSGRSCARFLLESPDLELFTAPLLGGAEAEGFGVGIHDEAPTPALRATPPERGFSQLPDVIRYFETQREHHRRQTLQEEYRVLLDKHGIDYDQRYLWG